jgi:hypothetical protein
VEDELRDTVPVIASFFSMFGLVFSMSVIVLIEVIVVNFDVSKWIMIIGAARLSFHLPLVLIFTIKSQDKKSKSAAKRTFPPKGLQYHEESPPDQHVELKKDNNETIKIKDNLHRRKSCDF